MMIEPLNNESPKMRTVDTYIYDELHRIFVHLAEAIAEQEDDPEAAVSIPIKLFQAEEYMRAAWDQFIRGQVL